MKVICPKCQYENQADSTRVVCARCATIIDVGMDQTSSLDSNGRRQTARLPFAANPGNSQSSNSQPQNSQQLNQPRDVYATRIGEEFDDVLDIPRQAQSSYDSSPVFDDVFSTPGYESTSAYDFSTVERKPTTPIENYQAGTPRYRETQDYIASSEPEFMGWPVLPETATEEEEEVSGFSSGKGGLLARIVLGALVFGGLVFGAYYFLGDLISKRKDQAENLIAGGASSSNQTEGKSAAVAPTVEVKPAATEQAETNESKNAVAPPVINPKPKEEAGQPANTAAKGDSKPVTIPPTMTGRAGHSDTAKPETTKPAPAPVASTPNNGNMTIQVASFDNQAQANERVARLKSDGIDARVVRAEIPKKGTWYRVQIGGFSTRQEAENYGAQLRSKGKVQDFIVTTIGK